MVTEVAPQIEELLGAAGPGQEGGRVEAHATVRLVHDQAMAFEIIEHRPRPDVGRDRAHQGLERRLAPRAAAEREGERAALSVGRGGEAEPAGDELAGDGDGRRRGFGANGRFALPSDLLAVDARHQADAARGRRAGILEKFAGRRFDIKPAQQIGEHRKGDAALHRQMDQRAQQARERPGERRRALAGKAVGGRARSSGGSGSPRQFPMRCSDSPAARMRFRRD